MPQWLLSTSMLSELAVVFSMQPCQAQTPSVRLKIAVVGTGVAASLQKAAQRARRCVGRNKPRQYQHRMIVAAWRQTEERQGAEKRTQFGNGSPLQKHQRSGRRRKRLRSNGHHISSRAGPLRLGSRPLVQLSRRNPVESFRNATLLHKKLRNRFCSCKLARSRQEQLKALT